MKKIVIAGACAYHFQPAILEDLLIRRKEPCRLWLVDADTKTLELTARAAGKLAAFSGCRAEIYYTAVWEKALPGADAVIVCSDFLDEAAWKKDVEMLAEVGLGKQARLAGGLGGAMQTMRAVGWVSDLAEEMARVSSEGAPLILCDSGFGGLPLARACEAAQRVLGVRTLGVSAVTEQTRRRLALYLDVPEPSLDLVCAGLNGFSWVTRLADRRDGSNLIPRCMKEMEEDSRERLSAQYIDWYGAIPAGHQPMQYELLTDTPESPNRTVIFSGVGLADSEIRKRDLAKLAVYGPEAEQGKEAWEHIRRTGFSQARPARLLSALWGGEPCEVPSLTMPCDGAVPGVPVGRFVEGPARVDGEGARGLAAPLPIELEDVLSQLSLVNLLYAEAAATGNRDALREALEIDPALSGVDLLYAEDLLERMMEGQKEKLHRFYGEE
ncbi:MAG: hypothetical protein K5746_00980 [Clostridiales bacterium]|nr:hypothetical protein [Clostridiales bacterium]